MRRQGMTLDHRPLKTSRTDITNHRNRQEATTLATLDTYQLRDLLTIVANPRHKMIASRTALFRRLELIVPTEPPRPPLDSRARRSPPGRAFAVTKLGLQVLVERGLLSLLPQPEASL